MRKQWFFLLILAALLLAACGSASSANSTTDAKATQTGQATSPADTQQTVQPTTAQRNDKPEMVCQVVSLSPTQGPTEASMFPPVSAEDHLIGAATNVDRTSID